ncbi:MAG: choice-of-anchor B family protein [Planctomycetales bacterium]|nr:choice-of-anchor B family protein [Planctomycetales bacterium]
MNSRLGILLAVLLASVTCRANGHDAGKDGYDEIPAGIAPLVTDDFGFTGENVIVTAHLPMSELGGADPISDRNNNGKANGSDLWGWTDPETNHEYALFGRSDAMAFVDVTNANAPLYLGVMPTQSLNRLYRDVKTFGNYAYVVADVASHGMQVFDLTRLRDRTLPLDDFWMPDFVYEEFGKAHNIVINPESGFALAVGTDTYHGGMHFLDLSNPLAPKPLGGVSELGYTHDAQAITYRGPDAEHVGREIVLGYTVDSLSIVDASDPATPVVLSRTEYEGRRYAHQGWVTDDQRYALMDDELDELQLDQNARTHIWNIEDLDAPKYVGYYEAQSKFTDHNLYIKGNLAYEANYLGGLRILDISNVENGQLKEVAWLDTQPQIDSPYISGLWSVYPYFDSGMIIMSDMVKGLIVAKLDSEKIELVGDFNRDGQLSAEDLQFAIVAAVGSSADLRYDLDANGQVDLRDASSWARHIAEATPGDANLDGVFNSGDFVQVFHAGEYEDDVPANSTWFDGDWTGDLEFTSADLVVAFQVQRYESASKLVPEPSCFLLIAMVSGCVISRRLRRTTNRRRLNYTNVGIKNA